MYNVTDLDGNSSSVLFNDEKNQNLGTHILNRLRTKHHQETIGKYRLTQLELSSQATSPTK